MRKAYSYIRFSSLEQKKGHSLKRQAEASAAYCEAHGLTLDTKLKLTDEGISAFKGRNKDEGALAEFLRLARRGDVAPGSVLLIESFDRLSRETPRKALRTLESIIETGVDVVTLMDNRVHTAETLDDFVTLMMSLMIMFRAHEESETKSKRITAAWEAKRKSGKAIAGGICPGWLRHDRQLNQYVEIPDRVRVVKRILAMALQGHGKRAIAKVLNREGVEPWGIGKKKAVGWHDSYIQKILHNDSVLGTYHPHILRNRKRIDLNTPRAGYYPAIISEADFLRVKGLAKTATPGSVKRVHNLFAGVLYDGYNPDCVMVFVDKGTAKRGGGRWRYLVSDAKRRCLEGKNGEERLIARVRYDEFEKMFLDDLSEFSGHTHDIAKDDPHREAADVTTLQDHLTSLNQSIVRLTKAIEEEEQDGHKPLLSLPARIRELEANRTDTLAKLEAHRVASAEASGMELEQARLQELLAANTVDSRVALRHYIKRLFARIDVYPQGLLGMEYDWMWPGFYSDHADAGVFCYHVQFANGRHRLYKHYGPKDEQNRTMSYDEPPRKKK
jgi:DNA invertase Pin-like site-specific DNA recombinase